ncbi:helix-turn-helix domain-containing protein [Xenophilus azovorans]|uniref:helix-turn-helix domain-containing protein n=1 Tax=Xenophilus azovorans TaxID=151755 RepID=UPI00056EE5B1|nr:helix-turn-helix domain-containing protein [Xenophilus azovorans]
MIERASEFGASLSQPLSPGDTSQLSAGDMLRQAREAHGLHVEVVAAALKVPPQRIEALENDDIEALPDPVFARALAASVARALRIDPAPVLAKLPGAQKVALAEADRSLGGSIRSHVPGHGGGLGGWVPSRPLMGGVAALLLAAAAVFWLPQSAFDRLGAWMGDLTSGAGGSAESDAPPAAAPVAAAAPGTVVESVAPAAAAPAGPAVAAAPEGTAAASVAPAQDVPAAPATAEPLVLTAARGECWVTVTDAGGKVLLQRILAAGETVHLSGALPLSVVLGRAASVDARVHGEAFDLAPLTKSGGVARFVVRSS